MDQRSGPSDQYIVPIAVPLVGPVDTSALASAIGDVVARHEALRTLLIADDQVLVRQEVVPDHELPGRLVIDRLDGSSWATAQVHAEVRDRILAPFSLADDLPIRAVLIDTEGGCVMGLGVHHSALDEWSIPTLHRDMVTAYRARTYGSAPTWSESPTQYADYAVWQRRLLGTVDDETSLLAEQLRYWTAALDEVPAVSGIPSDRIRPTDPTWSGRWREAVVPDVVVSMLREVARQQGVSMFMLTQAAVALAVSASGGGDDVVLGSPVGGRTDEALTDLVGYFVNTLPLRYDLTGNPTPADLLARVRATVLAGFENQETPFEEMVRAVGVERSGSATPLFQTMVTYREDGGPPDEFAPGIGFGSMDRISLNTLKSEAELYITVAADEITVVGGYSDELFSDSTVRRFTDTLMRAFEILATDVNTALAQVDLLTDRDRSRLHTCSRGTRVPEILSGTGTLDSLLATQAASTPDSVAIVFGDTTLTYAEFDARVNGLARLLLARGVRVGDRVAVVLPRGEWLPIALSAIVRSGAAYVPVDPSYPMERIDHLLSDSTPTAVITGRLSVGDELAGRLDHVPGRPEQIDLDDQTALREIAAMSDHPVTDHERSRTLLPDDAAYLIYTSGTTGKPKGVTISHQAIGNRLKWMQSEYGLDGADRVLQKTPFSFDVSVWEFFWPLMSGAAMIVAAPEGHKDPQYLTTLISERQITTVHFVPSMLAAFLDSGPAPAQLASVKRVFTSGEALSAQNASAAMAVFSGGVHNLYGPTEAAVDVTYQPIETDHTANPAVSGVPIGVPVANTDVFVLDHHLRLVPPGVPGELYLGGVQLARGYHDRPALTADRFVANLHAPSSEAGARMYRTGDLARWNADGRLEYLGRNDFQVKVRGFRIELGEVEAALASVDGVHAAVVVASTELGTTRLLGYVTPTRDVDTIDGMTVLEQAGLVLPSHMVPTTVTVLEAFPLTANGKLDRSALPEPSVQVRAEEQRAPTTESEKVLCEIYADVLGVGAVGVDDDFFALGGDSILSISVVRRAGQRGIGLKVHHLFDLRTPARTAALVDEGPPAESEVLDLPHRETSMTPIMHRQLAGAASPDTVRQIRIVLAPDETDLDRLRTALASVVVRHPALRMSIDTANDPRVRFVDEKVGQSSVTRLDARGVAEEDLAELIMDSEVRHSADISLAQGILTNIMYVERDAEQDLLVWTVNHFAVDFVSWHVLVDDLRASYRGDDLTPRWESSYATWMEHLNSESTLEQFRGELSYWQGQLASATPALESIDRTGSAVPGTGRVDATIAPAVGEQLFVGAGRIGTSLQDVLIATLVVALQRWRTRRGGPPAERMLVEFEGHGRPTALDDRLEVTQTVGWFTSMYPLAIPVSSDTAEAISAVPAAAADVVHAVADVVGDVPDQGVGYGVLTSLDAQSVPELAGLAEPDVLFNFAGVLGDFERENRAVAWETPPQSPAVISGRTDDSEHSHPITVDLHAVRSLAGTAVHYVIAGELSDDDFAEMSRYWQQAASEMAAGLDVVADSAGERAATPTAVVPLPTAHRIRTGGADLASAWYSEVIDVRSDLDIAELRAFLYSATRSIDSLRTRVEPRSSSIWWIDTVPPSPRAISERVTALDMSRLPRAEAIAAAAVELSDQIDVTAGQGLAAALVDSAVGRSVVVVAHALCIDRVGLHALAARIHDCTGPSAHPLVSDEFVSIADAAAAVDTFAEIRSEDDAGSRCLAALLDSERTSVEAASGTHAVSTVIDGLLDPLLVEEAFIRAARNTLGPVGIDREFDLRAVVTVPGTVEGPLTATYPQELSEGEFTGDDRAFFSLTRHAARTRRKLRSIAQESVLLTRVHGEPATLHGREGLEHLYPVVCRYFCGDSTITVVVIGVQQEIAEQVVDTWKQEISFGQREIR